MRNLALFLLALGLSQAANAATSPKDVVQTIIDRARALDDKAKHAENTHAIESLVDFHKLALDALGSDASEASAKQKNDIEALLKGIITRTVYPEAPKFFRDVTIAYTAEETGAHGATHITSVVTKGTKRSTVEYWLAPQADGAGFKVVDLAIEGERWVENVHEQFDEHIRKKGVAGLIQKMKKRLGELEAGKK